MYDCAVDPSANPLAQFQRVAPIALLGRSMGLEPHLVCIDHDGTKPHSRKLARHEEAFTVPVSSATAAPAGSVQQIEAAIPAPTMTGRSTPKSWSSRDYTR
jgi:hypothetical protein